MKKRMWGGRFAVKTNPEFEYFSSSIQDDFRLAPYDLKASGVHCRMLERQGVISAKASRKIRKALLRIEKNLKKSEKDFLARRYEDVHSFIELELIRLVGDDAKRLHAARSRNDQVNQATRMYLKNALDRLNTGIKSLEQALLKKAQRYRNVAVSGMTHLQKAQPVLVSHLLLSYLEALERSRGALKDTSKRVDVLTLGSGAFAGTSIPINREWMRRRLNFKTISRNSIDAVGSRDFVAEYLFQLALIGVHYSRIAEDLLIGQMEEIAIYVIPESLSTGSSMMPQKKNPDFLELVRGAASVLIGNSTALLTLLKGVPSSYNRDLQWDKAVIFQSTDLMLQMTQLFKVFFDGLVIDEDRAERSLANDALMATDLAERLVTLGRPFREAHEKVGKLARYCFDKGILLREAPQTLMHSLFGKNAKAMRSCLNVRTSLHSRKSAGGTSPTRVNQELKAFGRRIRGSV